MKRFHVAQTLGHLSVSQSAADGRHGHRPQDENDPDDHEHLYKRDTCFVATVHAFRIVGMQKLWVNRKCWVPFKRS